MGIRNFSANRALRVLDRDFALSLGYCNYAGNDRRQQEDESDKVRRIKAGCYASSRVVGASVCDRAPGC